MCGVARYFYDKRKQERNDFDGRVSMRDFESALSTMDVNTRMHNRNIIRVPCTEAQCLDEKHIIFLCLERGNLQ